MYGMFGYAESFNQNLERWNISNNVDTNFMFDGATALEKIPSWY